MNRSASELLEALQEAQAHQALMLDILKSQRNTSDPDMIMQTAAKSVGQYFHADRAGFLEVRNDVVHFSIGWTTGRMELLTGTLPVSEIGAVSLIDVPIIRNNEWCAGFYVNHSEVRHWTDDEVALVRNVGEQTWDAIERARAQNALRKSEEEMTFALEAGGGVGTWDWDIPAGRVYSDPRFARLFSVDPNIAREGAPIAMFIDNIFLDDRPHMFEKIRLACETENGDYSVEHRVLTKDGSVRWVQGRGRCRHDSAGKAVRLSGVAFDITERKQKEVDIQKQWHTFDTVLSNAPDFIYIFDLQGRFTYANRALLSLFEKNLEEVTGKTFAELDYPVELAARLQRQIQQVVDKAETLRDQTAFTSTSGETGVYEYIFAPVLDATGQVEAVAGTTRNITERNRAEKTIEEDRERWRDILMQTPAAIAVLRGPEHRFEWTNKEYHRLVGRSTEEFVGKTVLEALPEVEGQIYVKLLDAVYQTGEPFLGHESFFQVRRNDGTLEDIYINFVYLATRNPAGEIEGVFAHITEVTALVIARKLLESSEQKFRNLADFIPQIVWTAQADGHVDYLNDRWFNFSGLNRESVEDNGWSSLVHPDDATWALETWNRSVQSGEPYQIEVRLWDRHEDRWRWFMERAVSVRDDFGRVVKWFGTGTDIDEQKATQQAVLQTQKLESIGLLAGGIAHDFNNLLVGIMGGATLALDMILPSHPIAGMLQTVVRASERAADLTRQMLAYAGQGKFIIEPVDLSALATQTMELVTALIPKSVQIKLQLDQFLPAVQTDSGQMQQVVMNLIINAAEAVGDQNGLVTVRTLAEVIATGDLRRGVDGGWIAPGTYAVLEVADTGSGIEVDILSKIFDPFFTTKFTGRGLGLAAVSGIVRSHHGGIEVETVVGKGSTFRVLLPATSARASTPAVTAPVSMGKNQGTVLVIDDEEIVRNVAKGSLGVAGYRAVVANNGEDGIAQIRRDANIVLVLLDMSMPGLSGKQVLESLKEIRPTLPVVICSGYSPDEVYKHFSRTMIAGVLEKPFTAKQLAAKVKSVLDDVV